MINLKMPSSGRVEAEFCIIGSGPAGMTVASELARHGRSIIVVESGGAKRSPATDALRATESHGIQVKLYSRERLIGGASSTWAGLASPFDPIDFEQRANVRDSGWPLSLDELLPYYDQAAERYRFPTVEAFSLGGATATAVRQESSECPRWRALEEKLYLASVEPQHFGREFTGIFERDCVDLLQNATVTCLRGNPGSDRIDHALGQTIEGRKFEVHARCFILATGGIENARLLLNSREGCPAGLGNEHDNVGRYMMNHPKSYAGHIRLRRSVSELPYYFGFMHGAFAGYAGLRLSDAEQRARGLLNAYVRFEPMYAWSDNEGVEAFIFLLKQAKVLMRGFRRANKGKTVALRDYAETGDDSAIQNETRSISDYVGLLPKLATGSPWIAAYAFYRLVDRVSPRIRAVRLRNFMEMEPRRENRVTLGAARDRFGVPVPVVRHDSSELDRRSLVELHKRLAEEVAQAGFGELVSGLPESDGAWPVDQDASHHIGTTRMGDDPRTSVVDRNCRLHSAANVYLAGSSVFPTSGNVNPTYTIVALAIRLADHLKNAGSPS